MNPTQTFYRSTSSLVLFTASLVFGAVIAVGTTPAAGQDAPHSGKTGNTTGAAANPANSTPPEAGRASDSSDQPSAEDAAKLQAARIRYGRLAQNFPGQFTQFESRAKELDRLLRQALPEPPAPRRTTVAVIPLMPVKTDVAPVKASVKAPATQPTTVEVRVDDLKDLARRLQFEATTIRGLAERSGDGLSVALRSSTVAWVRSLDTLLRRSESKVEATARR